MESLETENPTNFLSLNQDANRPSTDTTALPTSKGRKHVRLTVDEDYIERISSDSELQSPKCSNHLLSFLESSHNWSIQTTPSLFNRQQKKLRKTIISKTLISRIAPILRCLQWLSLLPFVWNETACTRRQIFWKKILFWSMFALSFSLNLFLLVINLLIVVRLREMCNSVIHWRILTAVVTGMKPTINCVSFLSFAVLLKEHKTLLRKMMEADNGFYDLFQRSPPIEKYVRIFFVAATTSFVAPMVLRLMEYVAHGEVLGNSILSDASIFIVPLLSVWNCAPFLYFFVICAMLRFWFHSLAEEIRNDPFLKRRNLRFYYLHFSKLARVMDSVGQVFNPFVFFSVAWSMLTLCLTIYFLVKSGHIFNAMENDGIDIFNLSYCGIQISIAMVYLILIIVYGIQTNETARFVCIHLFALKSRELDAQDRFQVFQRPSKRSNMVLFRLNPSPILNAVKNNETGNFENISQSRFNPHKDTCNVERNGDNKANGILSDYHDYEQAPGYPVLYPPNGLTNSPLMPDERGRIMAPVPTAGSDLLKGLRPIQRVLQTFGYYPLCLDDEKTVLKPIGSRPMKERVITYILTGLFLIYGLILVAGNGYIFRISSHHMLLTKQEFGMLSAKTISQIVTGLKPFINLVQILVLTWKVAEHREYVSMMYRMSERFHELLSRRVNIRRMSRNLFIIVTAVVLFPGGFRVFEVAQFYKSLPEWNMNASELEADMDGHEMTAIDMIFQLMSPLIVTLLLAWGILPLMYFELNNRIFRFWFKGLREEIRQDSRLVKHSLEEYFQVYKELTVLLKKFGDIFNPFIAFSLSWSIISVCLALYFVCHSEEIEPSVQPTNSTMTAQDEDSSNSDLVWIALQIFIAVIFMLTITVTGFFTNEEGTYILQDVLDVNPGHTVKDESYQIECFSHRVSNIGMWGISIYRAFPLRRSSLLTMISIMITYAILLLNLKNK